MFRIYISVVFIFLSLQIYGQSGHYWTESFGTRSMLLNGAVIGSVEDLGAVFYNPARISQFESPAFVISGQVYQLNKTTIKNGLGDGLDLKKSDFGGGPSLVSGTFKLGFLEGHHFAYAFLTRSSFNQSFNFAVDEFGDFVKAFPGEEYFSGQINSNNSLNDEWIGLSWSYPINEKLSIGATGFYSSFERNAGVKLQLQAYSPDSSQTGMYIENRAYGFKSQSLLAKIGLSWQADRYSFGFIVTTPKFEGISSGNTTYETFLAGIDTTGNGVNDDVYIISNQDDLDVTHKSPWSVGIGAGVKLGKKSILHASAEWFSAIPSYLILQSEPFTGQSTGEELQMTIVDDLASVLNFGVGLEVFINENVSMFGSFATDFAAVKTEVDRILDFDGLINNTTFRADIYHMGFGTDIKTKFADLTIGATYANSRETVKRDFTIDDGQDPVTSDAQILYSRWRFLIGFSFPFLKDMKDKLEAE